MGLVDTRLRIHMLAAQMLFGQSLKAGKIYS